MVWHSPYTLKIGRYSIDNPIRDIDMGFKIYQNPPPLKQCYEETTEYKLNMLEQKVDKLEKQVKKLKQKLKKR